MDVYATISNKHILFGIYYPRNDFCLNTLSKRLYTTIYTFIFRFRCPC